MRDNKRSSSTSPCAPLRDAYHSCFNSWYADKFMKGHWDKEECVSEWQKYRACLSENLEDKHLSRFLETEGNVQDDPRKVAAEVRAMVSKTLFRITPWYLYMITGYQRNKLNPVTTSVALVLYPSAFLLGLYLNRASLYFRGKT